MFGIDQLPSLLLGAGLDPLGHVLDKDIVGSGATALTMNTITLFIAAAIFLVWMNYVASAIATGPESEGNERYITKGRFAQLIEVVVLYLRDEMIRPHLGDQTNRFLPFLLTLFFFILTCNLIGLVPLIDLQYVLFGYGNKVIGGTPTGRLSVTAALALIAFIVWQINGIRSNGISGWLSHFTAGAPWYIWPIIIPVEIVGMVVKPAALTIRLFANMTAGHVLLAAIVGFTGLSISGLGWIFGSPIAVIAFVGGVAIMFLEIFVSLLQAFIFMFLTTMFIAQMAHHDHDEQHHEEEDAHQPLAEATAVGAA